MHESTPQVVELVTNLDDVTGEQVADVIERLLAAGALDAWATPIVMKKGRPAIMLSVLCRPEDRQRLLGLLIEQTGTFGVRHRLWERAIVDRRHETVKTAYGDIRIKIGVRDGAIVTAKVEYDDAKVAAGQHGVAVRQVIAVAMAVYHRRCST